MASYPSPPRKKIFPPPEALPPDYKYAFDFPFLVKFPAILAFGNPLISLCCIREFSHHGSRSEALPISRGRVRLHGIYPFWI